MPREIVFNEDEVLAKVVDLFWKRGYCGTSMQDLTAVTGLNRSSIYNSFESKIALYKRALKIYQNNTDALFQKALLKSNNSKEALVLIFDFLVLQITEDIDSKGCFKLNCKAEMSQKDASIKEWLVQTQEKSIQFLEGLLNDGQRNGLINTNATANSYAHYLHSAFQGMQMTGVLVKEQSLLKNIAFNILKVLD